MASRIKCDPHLVSEALKLGNFKYKKDAVNAVLKEYLQHHCQLKILDHSDYKKVDEVNDKSFG